MIDSLYIAATGMHAHQTEIDVIAHNLANVNTMGFKKNQVKFEDLVYQVQRDIDHIAGSGRGAHVASSNKNFASGDLKQTGQPLDIAIRGEGFFEVVLPDGRSAYTRNGSLQKNQEGYLATPEGYILSAMIQIPSGIEEMVVQADGHVLARGPEDQEPQELGRIDLAQFSNSAALTASGENLYLANQASGEASMQAPGESGAGLLAQGFTEGSNVKLVEELTALILAQRAYEINSKVVQASDEMLGIINNLRR